MQKKQVLMSVDLTLEGQHAYSFPIQFFLVAITFPLFDLEIALLPSVRCCAGHGGNQAAEGTVPALK